MSDQYDEPYAGYGFAKVLDTFFNRRSAETPKRNLKAEAAADPNKLDGRTIEKIVTKRVSTVRWNGRLYEITAKEVELTRQT